MEPVPQSFSLRWTKRHFLLAAGLGFLAAVLALVAWRTGLMTVVDAMIVGLREAGPLFFFGAMALLPAVGFPLLAFTLAAGPVFGPVLGPGWVIAWSLAAVLANLLLTYWLANRALRPLVSWLLAWFGFPLPDQTTEGVWQLTLIVRLTPGPPFWAQSYLLGLLRVPLVPYLAVSMGVMTGFIVALVCGGDAIAEGKGRVAFVAAVLLLVAGAALQLLRKWAARRRAAAALSLDAAQACNAK